MVVAALSYRHACHWQGLGSFFLYKLWNRAKDRKNPTGIPGSVCFHQTLGNKFTFQQDNNLKHKVKYTLEKLTKTALNVPEWPSYSFDINHLENVWQNWKLAVQQSSTTNLTELEE